MHTYKSILFDVDGVLIDSMPIWENSANDYLREVHGIDAPPEVDKNCETLSLLEAGEYIKGLYPKLPLSPREIADGVAAHIRKRYWKAPERKGMISTVTTLKKKGYHLYLATASETENVKGALNNLGVWDCFQDIFTCTEVGFSKRYVEYYEEVSKRLGIPCDRLIMVEDSLHSMVSAKKAGLKVIGVFEEYSRSLTEEIQKTCDAYIQSLDLLLEVLSHMNQNEK